MTEKRVQLDWDPAKKASNARKHGITVEEASEVFDDPRRFEWISSDAADDEERYTTVGRVGTRILADVYTERGHCIFQHGRRIPMRNGGTSRDSPGREAPEERTAAVDTDNPPEGRTDWAYLEAMTGEEAHRNALADPDNPPLTPEQLARMRRIPNPKQLRLTLNLSQEEFARQFQIGLYTLRDWEQGVRRPDSIAKTYLRVIEAIPDAVREALRSEPPERLPTAEEGSEARRRRVG